MKNMRHLTTQTVEELRLRIKKRLDWYYQVEGRKWAELEVEAWGIREVTLPADPVGKQLIQTESTADAENAVAVHNALVRLAPRQAADERLWVYLCHAECAHYMRRRWLGKRPKKDEDAVREIQNHFFVNGNRGLIRDNGVSRLWWLGFIARKVDAERPRRFLDILLHRQDVRSALIERPSVSMNTQVLQSVYAVMREHWNEDEGKPLEVSNPSLFQREVFRDWMIGLNRRGGVVLLDALPEKELGVLVREEADRALQAGSDGGQSQF